jgi:MFS family permease
MRIEAAGPARFLGAAALVVALALACYGVIPQAAAALLVGTVVFSFAEAVFSSAVPATVARLAPAGRRGAYQGAWALVQSLSMGSALFVGGLLRDAAGWRTAWIVFALLAVVAAIFLLLRRERFEKRD